MEVDDIMRSRLIINQFTEPQAKIQYHFFISNIRSYNLTVKDGNEHFNFDYTDADGFHVDGFVIVNGISQNRGYVIFKTKPFSFIYGIQGYSLYIRLDALQHLGYIDGSIFCPDQVILEKKYKDKNILLYTRLSISKENFMSFFRKPEQDFKKSRKNKHEFKRDTSLRSIFTVPVSKSKNYKGSKNATGLFLRTKFKRYKSYTNAFRPYQGGRCSPK